jgi:hypothetical protein
MVRVDIGIPGYSSRTTDTGYDYTFIRVKTRFIKGGKEAGKIGAQSAAGTPDVGHSIGSY